MKKLRLMLSLSGALFIFAGTLSALAITKDEEKIYKLKRYLNYNRYSFK